MIHRVQDRLKLSCGESTCAVLIKIITVDGVQSYKNYVTLEKAGTESLCVSSR